MESTFEAESSRLRKQLVRFLSAKGAADPDELASETFVRVLQKVKNGLKILNLDAYAYRVAQNVLQEDFRHRVRHHPLEPDQLHAADRASPNIELLQCLEHCKRTCLARRDVRFIEAYYSGTKVDRQKLALKADLTENALRLKAFKIRKRSKTVLRLTFKTVLLEIIWRVITL